MEFEAVLFVQVTAATRDGDTIKLTVEPAKGGDPETLEADVVLVSAGGSPLLTSKLSSGQCQYKEAASSTRGTHWLALMHRPAALL